MTEEEIQELQETNRQLTERVNQLESINSDLVTQKKELKQKLEEGMTDEEMKAELDNYKSQLAQVEADKQAIKEEYTKEISTLQMVQQLKELGIETHNNDALMAVSELALSDAKYQDGGFKFLNEDGTTRFNDADKEYSLIDKVNELRGGEKSYLFKDATGAGTEKEAPKAPIAGKNDVDAIRSAYSF